MNVGKTSGWIAIGIGVAILLIVGLFLGSGVYTGRLTIPGAALGIGLFGCLPMIALTAVGVFLLVRGRAEEKQMAAVRKQERLLGMIQAQGQVPLDRIMLELKMTREEVTNTIYEMVNLGLFTGYIDWEAMVFYSKDAQAVGTNKCPNCGGIREFVGQGIIKCPYCGVSLFIPPNTPNTRAEPQPPTG